MHKKQHYLKKEFNKFEEEKGRGRGKRKKKKKEKKKQKEKKTKKARHVWYNPNKQLWKKNKKLVCYRYTFFFSFYHYSSSVLFSIMLQNGLVNVMQK